MISVLYVDDEQALLEIMKIYLERTGEFLVDTVDSAALAFEKLKTTRYDAVVSDYQMPEMDGIEFLKALRKKYSTLPFIIFTGRGREEVVIQAFESGADFYLQKGGAPRPQFAELAHKITTIVEQRKLTERVFTLNRLYSVLSMTNHAIIHRRNVRDLLEEVCQISVDTGGFKMAWSGKINEMSQQIEPFVSCGDTDGYLEKMIVSARDIPEGRGPTGTAYREERYVVINQLATDPAMAPWRDEALKREFRSIAAFPFALKTRYAGTFTLFAGEPDFFDDQIVKLLSEMMSDITFALRSLEAEEHHEAVDEKILRNEEKLRFIFDAAPSLFISVNRSGIIIDSNQRVVDMLGYGKEEIVNKPISLLIHRNFQHQVKDLFTEIQATGTVRYTQLQMIKKDGTEIDVRVNAGGLRDRNGIVFRTVWILEDITRYLRMEEELTRLREAVKNSTTRT
jgi:PAS domain S-box-containing protein